MRCKLTLAQKLQPHAAILPSSILPLIAPLLPPADFINKQVDTLENGLAAKQKDLVQHQRKVTADLAGEPRIRSIICPGFAQALKLSLAALHLGMSMIMSIVTLPTH